MTKELEVLEDDDCLFLHVFPANSVCGESSGSITVDLGSGIYPCFSYSIKNDAGTISIEEDKTNVEVAFEVSELPAGSYTIEATDHISGCTATENITIEEDNNFEIVQATITYDGTDPSIPTTNIVPNVFKVIDDIEDSDEEYDITVNYFFFFPFRYA